MYGLIVLAIVSALVVAAIVKFRPGSRTPMWCPNCGAVGAPVTVTRGSLLVELVLWLMMVLPGVLYSVWRLTTRHQACPVCKAAGMIPVESPRARAALREGAPTP